MARIRGTVTKIAGSVSLVDTEVGELHCDLRARLFKHRRVRLAVGDRVWLTPLDTSGGEVEPAVAVSEAEAVGEPPRGVIEEVEERRTVLRRPRDYKRDQVLVANVDRVFIVVSVFDPPYKRTFVDRLIVAVLREGLEPLVVFNKMDLAEEDYRELIGEDAGIYEDLGYSTLLVSAGTGEGLDALREAFRDRISAVVGPSGVGKSTLLNAVVPGLRLRTAEVSAADGRGRHTTTAAELVPVPGGGFVVDTPGLRGFGMWDVSAAQVLAAFPDVAEAAARCKFSDCSHRVEPGCAVRAEVEAGELDAERFESYQRILEEIEAGADERQTQRRR